MRGERSGRKANRGAHETAATSFPLFRSSARLPSSPVPHTQPSSGTHAQDIAAFKQRVDRDGVGHPKIERLLNPRACLLGQKGLQLTFCPRARRNGRQVVPRRRDAARRARRRGRRHGQTHSASAAPRDARMTRRKTHNTQRRLGTQGDRGGRRLRSPRGLPRGDRSPEALPERGWVRPQPRARARARTKPASGRGRGRRLIERELGRKCRSKMFGCALLLLLLLLLRLLLSFLSSSRWFTDPSAVWQWRALLSSCSLGFNGEQCPIRSIGEGGLCRRMDFASRSRLRFKALPRARAPSTGRGTLSNSPPVANFEQL